jgi:hypothetical protein
MTRNRFAAAAAVSALSLAAFVSPAAAGFKAGQYTQTLFSGPTHQGQNPTCVTFTKTGGVAGFKSSGTWAVGDTIGGNYVADGNDLRWYGIRTGSSIVFNFHANAKSGKGGYDLWIYNSALPLDGGDDGTLTLTPGCD